MSDVLPEGWMEAVERGDEAGFAALRSSIDFRAWPTIIGPSGYAAPLWPRQYGGLSGEPWMLDVIRRELSQWRLPLIGLNLLGLGMAGPTLIEHGTEKQRRRHLSPILTGAEIWSKLFSGPEAGSDLASLSTRAERDGDEWVVNGQKVWTTIAQFAHYGLLLARTGPDMPKHEGLTHLICDLHAPGVEVRPLRQMTGGAEFNEVFLKDVRIPAGNRVGEAGDGWRVARTTIMNERVALSGITLDPAAFGGSVRRDPWLSYLERMPANSDPTIRRRLTSIYIKHRVKEMTAARADAARSSGRQPGPEGAIAKVFDAEHTQRRAELSLDAAGMHSVAWLPGDTGGDQHRIPCGPHAPAPPRRPQRYGAGAAAHALSDGLGGHHRDPECAGAGQVEGRHR